MRLFTLLIAACVVLSVAIDASAWNNQIGFLGGANLSNIDHPTDDYDNRTGVALGGLFEIGGDNVRICFQPMYVQKGAVLQEQNRDIGTISTEMQLYYIEVPALLKIVLGDSSTRPYFMGGPTVGILTSSKVASSAAGIDLKVDTQGITEQFDFGVIFGGGVAFAMGRNTFFVEGRYSLGLADIAKEGEIDFLGTRERVPDEEVETRGVHIMAGFSMPIGG